MQYIFIDSNIFFRHWYMDSPNFIYLFNYLHLTGARLLISDVVVEEVDNLFLREVETATRELAKSKTRFDLLFEGKPKTGSLPALKTYSFRKSLDKKSAAVIYFDYKSIPNTVLVERAIKQVLPFRENEKGFRDTLIWLSLLEWTQLNAVNDEIIFINNNHTDYFEDKKSSLHPDLQADVTKLKHQCTFKPYTTLADFTASIPNSASEEELKDKIQFFLDDEDHQIADWVEVYMKLVNPGQLTTFLNSHGIRLPYVNTILDFDFLVMEGIEDPVLLDYKSVSLNAVLITYQFDLRICELLLGIPVADYQSKKQEIDSYYNDVYLAEETHAYFSRFIRPTFEVSFIFDFNTSKITNLEVLKMNIDLKS